MAGDGDGFADGRRRGALDHRVHEGPERHRAQVKAQLARDDPRNVEQVLHQLRLQTRVALHRVERAFGRLRCQRPGAQHPYPAEHRRQRCAQLVREHGEELVLGAARVLRLAVESRVVGGERGALREVLGQREVGERVASLAVGDGEGHDAQRAAARAQRHQHERGGRRAAVCAQVLRIAHTRGEPLVTHVAHERRLTALDHRLEHAVRSGTRGAGQRALARQPLLDERIGVGRGEAAKHTTVGLEHVHQHIVGEVGDGDARDTAQRRLVVERGGEHAAGLGEKRRAAPRLLGVSPRDLRAAPLGMLVVVEPTAIRDVAHDGRHQFPHVGVDRAHADLGGKAAAVTTDAVDVALDVACGAHVVGQQHRRGPPEEFATRIAEQRLGARVHQPDRAVGVDEKHRVGRGVEQGAGGAEAERLGRERRQQQRHRHRRHRRRQLEGGGQPEARLPQAPHGGEVRGAVGDDEAGEGDEDARVGYARRPPRKVQQRGRDRRAGEADREVADEVQDEQLAHGYLKNGKSIR